MTFSRSILETCPHVPSCASAIVCLGRQGKLAGGHLCGPVGHGIDQDPYAKESGGTKRGTRSSSKFASEMEHARPEKPEKNWIPARLKHVDTGTDTPTLGARGQIFVTETVAQDYVRQRRKMLGFEDMNVGDARWELTELLLDAKCKREETEAEPASYRVRSRRSQLDIGVTVRKEGRLLVVLSVSAREHTK